MKANSSASPNTKRKIPNKYKTKKTAFKEVDFESQSKERKGALYLTSLSSDNCTEALFPTPADRTDWIRVQGKKASHE